MFASRLLFPHDAIKRSLGKLLEGVMTKLVSAYAAGAIALLFAASTCAQSATTTLAGSDNPDSPRIAALGAAVKGGDPAALARFWREIEGKTPLVEPIEGDAKHVRVTFIWRGTNETKRVLLIGGVPGGDDGLDHLERTDLWYLSQRIPVRRDSATCSLSITRS